MEGLTTDDAYAEAVRNVRLFLEGRHRDLSSILRKQMDAAAESMRFEQAASIRDLISTVEEMEQKQKMAAAEGDDTDIFAYYAEPPLVAVNLFHMRNGHIVDRREFFWEDQIDSNPSEFFEALLKQVYLNQPYIPGLIHVPVEFEDREDLEEYLSEKRGRKVEIHTPQRGQKKAMLALVETNAKHSFDARFRVMKPSLQSLQETLQDLLSLPEPPKRIECFDISHIQGTDKVASMVVWEDGKMKKSDYRKFIIRTVIGNDDFASMREVVTRRYSRLQEEGRPFPSLVSDRRRPRPTARRARCAREHRHHQSAARLDREARRVDLRARPGRRAHHSRQVLAGAAPDPADPRRSAPLRRHVPSHAAQRGPPYIRAEGHRWYRPEDSHETVARVWQYSARAGSSGTGPRKGSWASPGETSSSTFSCEAGAGSGGGRN